ncbi:hypothetical protein D9758_018749 [Tetrapyrgos nigripes]|uniref:Retrotransposon gag domain-containing protein n=1 Tax=Tetrapyrgos nigripes TaxID=182062 RepID=A0A8H5FEN1_9AGAR|nr:hypothetical protein D9758_018749 [Tetrapyrgos nigripes]
MHRVALTVDKLLIKWTSHLWQPFLSELQIPFPKTPLHSSVLFTLCSFCLITWVPTMSEAFDACLARLEQASQSQSEQLTKTLAALQGRNPPPPTQPPSQHPTRPPSSASSSTPPSHHSSGASHAKASPPGIFDVRFQDDVAKIMWTLSYFQTGRAATYCQGLIDRNHLYGSSCFDTWEEFEKEFIREFMLEDERTQASLTLEGASYFQGTTSVNEYVDNFHALITMAGLNVEPVLYSTNPTNPAIKA